MHRKISLPRGKRAASGVLLTLFEGFQLAFPHALTPAWEDWVYRLIAVIGATGIIDYYLRKTIKP